MCLGLGSSTANCTCVRYADHSVDGHEEMTLRNQIISLIATASPGKGCLHHHFHWGWGWWFIDILQHVIDVLGSLLGTYLVESSGNYYSSTSENYYMIPVCYWPTMSLRIKPFGQYELRRNPPRALEDVYRVLFPPAWLRVGVGVVAHIVELLFPPSGWFPPPTTFPWSSREVTFAKFWWWSVLNRTLVNRGDNQRCWYQTPH